jgi:hypothetical protein
MSAEKKPVNMKWYGAVSLVAALIVLFGGWYFELSAYVMGMFLMFIEMLVGLMFFHEHKLRAVLIGFPALSATFIMQHGGWHWGEHFIEWHRFHLLYNLALLLPAFSLIAYYFEHSGASFWFARRLKSDTALLWVVFGMSIIIDNIAAAMIGGTILVAKYGAKNWLSYFPMIVGAIASSNLGGCGSPIGDTTTVMMYMSKDPVIPVSELVKAFFAAIPAQIIITMYAVRHDAKPQSYDVHSTGPRADVIEEQEFLSTLADQSVSDTRTGEAEAEGLRGVDQHKIQWGAMLPLLGIPTLIAGNVMFDQPGFGACAGLLVGVILGRQAISKTALEEACWNALFLVLLVATAEMLPLSEIEPLISRLPRDVVAVVMGHLSAWFDNIPLTAICLSLKGFDWGLLAYCVGFGGSAMWFGSSAGVAMGIPFPDSSDTRKWIKPFFVVTGAYLVGVASYAAITHALSLM